MSNSRGVGLLHLMLSKPAQVDCYTVCVLGLTSLTRYWLGSIGPHAQSSCPLSAGDAFKRIHAVFPQLKFDRN